MSNESIVNPAENKFICPFHEAHTLQLKRNANDIQILFKLDGKMDDKVDKMEQNFNEKIDGIKNMIIAGLGVSVVQLAIVIGTLIVSYIKSKGG